MYNKSSMKLTLIGIVTVSGVYLLSMCVFAAILSDVDGNYGSFKGVKVRDLLKPGFEIENSKLCSPSNSSIHLLLVVMSAPQNFLRRKAIRETWASGATDQVKVAFLTGKAEDPVVDFQLQQEHRIHQDIIKVNFLDVYTSLSLKSASMLNWVHTFCKNAQFAIKVDEDMMVNVKRMSSYFQAQENASKTIYCRVKPAGNKVIRDRKSKYFVPSSMYPNDVYPEYCAGPAYAITSDAITELWHQVMDEQFVWMEDFLITGLAAGNLGLRLVDNDDFVAQSPKNPRREEVLNYLVYYGRSHECMRLLWNEHVKAERRGFLRK